MFNTLNTIDYNSDKNKLLQAIINISPVVLVFCFNLIFFNRYFPLTEGWWETYGYLVNKGLIPYKDFNVAFPPLFIFLNAFYLKYITTSFFILRFIGVIVFTFNVFLLQRLLNFFFDRKIAAISALVASFLYMSDPVFVAKDYHTYAWLLIILSFICGYFLIKNVNDQRTQEQKTNFYTSLLLSFLLGFSIALVTLIKQNVGIFLFLSFNLSICFISNYSIVQKLKQNALIFFGFTTAFVLFFLYLTTYNVPFFDITSKLFLHNDSKGSTFTILFRILTDKGNLKLILVGISLFALAFPFRYGFLTNNFILYQYLNNFFQKKQFSKLARGIIYYTICAIVFVLLVKHNNFYEKYILILSIAILLDLFVSVYLTPQNGDSQKIALKFILIPLVALVYANTNTSTINFNGMFLVIAVTIAYSLEKLLACKNIKFTSVLVLSLIIVAIISVQKLKMPYSWIGLSQSSILKATTELSNIPHTKGIYVDQITAEVFKTINEVVGKYSKNDKDVYFYPSIPMFYYLYNKVPPYKNVVQWFDVISSSDIKQELNDFKASPPKVIVFLDPPRFVYQLHYKLIKRPLTQIDFETEFEKLMKNGEYSLYKYVLYNQELLDLDYDNDILSFVLKNKMYNNYKLSALVKSLSDTENVSVVSLLKNGITSVPITADTIVNTNDLINIRVTESAAKLTIENLGYVYNTKKYTIKIYIRND